MLNKRIIPTLLMKDDGLVKGKNFKNHRYVGDPINAVKIFNQKEVDELVFLDISARENNIINFELISDIASEAFMPLAYGGGIRNIEDAERILFLGYEKVIINSECHNNPDLINQCSETFGASSVVASIDVKKNIFGNHQVFTDNGSNNTKIDPLTYAKKVEEMGAGEIFLCSIDKEGCRKGFDINLMELVSNEVKIPIIASGGARDLKDFSDLFRQTNVSAASGGELFIFYGVHRAVLINYPTYDLVKEIIS